MVTDKEGYEHLILYLAENLSIFETPGALHSSGKSVMSVIEEELIDNIITVCTQHQELEVNHRSVIVREVDSIVYDLQEILSGVLETKVTEEQYNFISEFVGLIKNLFDSAIASLLD